jgi:hypothetical protein
MRDTFRYGEDLGDWENKIEFWANEYEGNLHHRNIDDAIEDILSGEWGPPSTIKELEDIEEIELCGYVRMEVNEDVDKLVLYHMEHLLEGLDEEYNCGEPTEITDSMKEAAAEFIRKVLAEYVPWNCESVITVTVPVMEWVKANRPDWLEENV